jgi:hypothetical protein
MQFAHIQLTKPFLESKFNLFVSCILIFILQSDKIIVSWGHLKIQTCVRQLLFLTKRAPGTPLRFNLQTLRPTDEAESSLLATAQSILELGGEGSQ